MQKALSVHRLRPLVRRLSVTAALHPPPVKATPTLDFTDSQQAFAATSTLELLRGAAVLTACSQPWLVRHADEGLALSRRLLGESTTHALLRHTVFAHFVAGEDAAEIAPKLQQLHGVGVGGILDYAAEADLSSPPATPDVNQPSRVYTYESEEKCDANLAVFLEAVDAVHATTPEGFAAVKVTALGDPQLLERASTALVQLRAFFETLDPAGTGVLSREAFIAGWREAFDVADDESAAAFESIDTDASGDVDIIEFLNAMPLEAVGPLVQRCRSRGPLFHSALDADECGALERMLGRLDAIAAHAKALGVRLMIDAEHTYFQPAIDHAVLRLSRAHNTSFPCVFGTYQAYLVECNSRLALDVERARREGWHFGAKVVRGAYMIHERQRAADRGEADPILPTVDATHASYDGAIDALLLDAPSDMSERLSVMVASHNQASVARVARMLLSDETKVPADRVYFGQLLGMADHLTFTLASHGLKAYKYVPWGPVGEVLPYLVRRAQENADALSGAAAQRDMMLAEVRRRAVRV